MIWPMFLDEHGKELPKGAKVPQVSRAHFGWLPGRSVLAFARPA